MPGWTRGRQDAGGYINRHQRDRILSRDRHVCHVCGHAGADQADHVVCWAEGGTHGDANLAAIHGRACPTCGKQCHADKTKAEAQRGRDRARARRQAAMRTRPTHPGLLTSNDRTSKSNLSKAKKRKPNV